MQQKLDRIRVIFALIMLFSGICIFSYPIVSNALARRNATIAIQRIEEEAQSMDEDQKAAILAAATAYNDLLRDAHDRTDRGEGENTDISYVDMLDTGAALGYITIPSIDVNLPIFEGVGEDVLRRGVGHLMETSFPIGGESTHSALSGHRGLAGAVLFTDLDRLQRGDLFYLHVLDEVLAYQVDLISTVLPYESSALEIIEGGDYCTLVTCTPIGVNSHRLLVRGERTEYSPEGETENKVAYQSLRTGNIIRRMTQVWPWLALVTAIVVGIEAVIMLFVLRRVRREYEED